MHRLVVVERIDVLIAAMFVLLLAIIYFVYGVLSDEPFRIVIGIVFLSLSIFMFARSDKYKIDKTSDEFQKICESCDD